MKLYDVLEVTANEITVYDKNYAVAISFHGIKNETRPLDKLYEVEMDLAKLIDVVEFFEGDLTVNLGEVIESKMQEIKEKNLFFTECNVDDIISIIDGVLARGVSYKLLAKFVGVLKGGEEKK